MSEAPHIIYPNLNDQQQFRLNKINEVKDYFIAEIKERKLVKIRLFYYFDKSLVVLSIASGGISIASFATIIGAPVGIASASFSFAFSISTGIVKKLLKTTCTKSKSMTKLLC